MLFSSAEFVLFLVAVQGLYRVTPARWRRVMLLMASYFFYMSWGPAYGLLLAGISTLNWGAGRLVARGRRPKAVVAVAVGLDLGVLAFYKYTGFLLENVASLLHALDVAGVDAAWAEGRWTVILPLGISFFTFQGISYTVDVYRDPSRHVPSLFDMLLFNAWFPQLVAGPIVRAGELVPQLRAPRPPGYERWQAGMALALRGFFKKAVLADNLALIVDPAFADHARWDTGTAWLVMGAYALQIYFDFSGYTDIAIGLSRTFGIDLPRNFQNPYGAASITAFWRRWHITLSSWLRDYLYIPLGGNRHGRLLQYRNLMLTMLLGGLWHGASWNFVIWGGYHGLLLSAHKLYRAHAPADLLRRLDGSRLWRAVATAGTFVLVVISWVPFRAQTLGQTLDILETMLFTFRFSGVPREVPGSVALVALLTYAAYRLGRVAADRSPAVRRVVTWGASRPAFALACMTHLAILIFIMSVEAVSPFIYFQF